ncbi:restriction endonuclease [Candidatus Pacearchaeota archaeon]|nr:restriction endonuclease [Candidatus Pacearchaeota archaeon]
MYVIKASGEKERFMPKKLNATLIRSGADGRLARQIVEHVTKEAYDGITTQEILNHALSLLRDQKPEISARYNLKRAIMNLGPTGFPFEKFIAEVLNNYGYETKVGQIVKGKVIPHEVDIVAKKKDVYMVECKYHNAPGIYTDVKVALYVYAAFLDLKDKFDKAWIITNTRCSEQAKEYARGMGIKITSWEYPQGESLRDLIEEKKLYPLTVLNSLNHDINWKLSNAGIFLTKDLVEMDFDKLKSKTKIQENVLRKIVEESRAL